MSKAEGISYEYSQQYPYEIRPLGDVDRGGCLIFFPDFSECLSDRESVEEAIQNGLDALSETFVALESIGQPVLAMLFCTKF
jgi:antitoxin HicB